MLITVILSSCVIPQFGNFYKKLIFFLMLDSIFHGQSSTLYIILTVFEITFTTSCK